MEYTCSSKIIQQLQKNLCEKEWRNVTEVVNVTLKQCRENIEPKQINELIAIADTQLKNNLTVRIFTTDSKYKKERMKQNVIWY